MTVSTTSENKRVGIDLLTTLSIGILFAAPYLSIARNLSTRYLIADAAIVAVVVFRFREDALRRLGLSVPTRDLYAALVTLAIGFLLAQQLVERIASSQQIEILNAMPLFSLSQVFHQEIVLRGLLLGAVIRILPSPFGAGLICAIVFAGLHPLLFWWSFDLAIPLVSILSLFAFGLATNILFIRFEHIAFSFAAHAAWNVARFGGGYSLSGERIGEAQTFVVFEGSVEALWAAMALLAVAAAIGSKRAPTDGPPRD
jgi:hypothetical protein